jgi:hypothetical protein
MTNNSEQYEAVKLNAIISDLNQAYAEAGFDNIRIGYDVDHSGNVTLVIKGGVEPIFNTTCVQHPIGTTLMMESLPQYANNACEDRGLRTS